MNFEDRLKVFRREVEGCAQALFSYLAIHGIAGKDSASNKALSKTPLLVNTILHSLQLTAFVTLGRVLDKAGRHNVHLLIEAAREPGLFTKDALAARKRRQSANADEWLAAYLLDVHVPTEEDFVKLAAHVDGWCTTYNGAYRDIRNWVFAHRVEADSEKVGGLFAKTLIRDLEQMVVGLIRLHEAFWQLYQNGHKLELPEMRSSAVEIIRAPIDDWRNGGVHERIVLEADRLLNRLAVGYNFAKPRS